MGDDYGSDSTYGSGSSYGAAWLENVLYNWGYEKIGLIGKGAFARVYHVREVKTKNSGMWRSYACKVSSNVRMLRREACLLTQICHPLFPKFHEIKEENQIVFLFMEYVPGINLATFLENKGSIQERRAAEIAVKLAEGLCYMHEQNPPVLFRDVKPQNIIIGEDGRVTLLDLGSAGAINNGVSVITGTPGYAAPEQLEKGGKVGLYSDVYALGKVMQEMLTGCIGTERDGRKNRWSDVRVHRGMKRLVEECISRDIGKRIPNMRFLLHRLLPYSRGKWWEILWTEMKNLYRRECREYIFKQNVIKMPGDLSEE